MTASQDPLKSGGRAFRAQDAGWSRFEDIHLGGGLSNAHQPTRITCRAGRTSRASGNLFIARICRCRRSDELRSQYHRRLPTGRRICRPGAQWRQACDPASAAIHQGRVGAQNAPRRELWVPPCRSPNRSTLYKESTLGRCSEQLAPAVRPVLGYGARSPWGSPWQNARSAPRLREGVQQAACLPMMVRPTSPRPQRHAHANRR
jgi:hypothetical protein